MVKLGLDLGEGSRKENGKSSVRLTGKGGINLTEYFPFFLRLLLGLLQLGLEACTGESFSQQAINYSNLFKLQASQKG